MEIRKIINNTLVHYGPYAEYTTYLKPHYVYKVNDEQTRVANPDAEKTDFSLSRTRTKLYRYIWCNIGAWGKFPPVFFTVTYERNETDIRKANNDFRCFIKRLNTEIRGRVKYICIPEFQERGAVHYHIMFFNLPYIKKERIQAIWGHGSTRIEAAANIDNLAAYMAKYLSKDMIDNRLKGHRLLLTSKGLQKPEIYDNNEVDDFNFKHPFKLFESRITLEHKIITKYKLC